MERYNNSLKEKSFNFFLPIAFILSIIPLIVRMTAVNVDEATSKIFGPSIQPDLFSQKKALFLIVFSILLVIISIIFFKKIFSKKNKITYSILISCSIFFLFTLLSAVFSKYREVSFYGFFDRAEGLITIACYMILFVYSIYTFKNTTDYKYIITPLLILVFMNAFLGLFQCIGQDLIKTSLGVSIAIPSEYKIDPSQLNLNNGTSIYGTLFNSNYVGSFTAIILPILFCLTIFEDDILKKIMLFLGTGLSIFLLLGSNSRSGIIGILFSIILGSVIFGKLLLKRRKGFFITFLVFLVLCTVVIIASKTAQSKLITLSKDIQSILTNTNDFDYRDHTFVKDIKHVDKSVHVLLPNETLKISYENGSFIFKNSKDQIIPYVKSDKSYTTTDKTFKNISFGFSKFNNKSIITDTLFLQINNKPLFIFRLKDDKSIHLIDGTSKEYIDVEFPETFGFKGKEKLGSSRGYIWSRSLPLLKDNLILGGGPDTFALRFPQNDLIGKYYALGNPNTVTDKPHNLYLQIALNYGIVALVAFLAIIIIYIVDSFKLYAFKEYYEKSQILGAVNSLGVIGYLFAGLFNDSVVSVAPIFWIILGVGVSLNYMNRKTLAK
jgi:O-antigen ligase